MYLSTYYIIEDELWHNVKVALLRPRGHEVKTRKYPLCIWGKAAWCIHQPSPDLVMAVASCTHLPFSIHHIIFLVFYVSFALAFPSTHHALLRPQHSLICLHWAKFTLILAKASFKCDHFFYAIIWFTGLTWIVLFGFCTKSSVYWFVVWHN